MEESKKKLVMVGVAVVCLGGAVLAYVMMSGPSLTPEQKAAQQAAQAHAAELEKAKDAANEPPPEIQRPATKGAQQVPTGR